MMKVVASAVSVLVVLLIISIILLRGEFGSRKILHYGQIFLKKKMLTDLSYSEGRIDFLSGFHFRDLKIVRNDVSMQASIEIPAIDLSYNISISHKRFEIIQLIIKDAKIRLIQHAQPVPSAPPQETQPAESVRSKIERYILNPPVELVIDQIAIEKMDLFADLNGPALEQVSRQESTLASDRKTIELHQFDFHLKMEMVKEKLAASGDISMAPRNQLSIDMRSTSPVLTKSPKAEYSDINNSKLQSTFTAGGQWGFDVHREGKRWLYRLVTNGLKLNLDQLSKTDRSHVPEQNSQIRLDHAEFNFDSNSLLHSDELFKINRSSVETMKVMLIGKTSEISAIGLQGKTLVGPQSIRFSTLPAEDLDFDLLLDSTKVQQPPAIPKGVALKVKAHGSIRRSLDHLLLNSQIELAGQPLLDSRFELSRKEKVVAFRGNGNLSLSPAQARGVTAAHSFYSGLRLDFQLDGTRLSDGTVESTFKTQVPKLVMAPIPKQSNVDIDSKFKWQPDVRNLDFSGKIDFQNPIDGSWSVTPVLHASLKGAPLLKGRVDIAQTAKPTQEGVPLLLGQPVHVEYDVDLGGKGHAIAHASLPRAEIRGKAALDGTELSLTVLSPDLKAAQDLKIEFEVKQAELKLANTYSAKLPAHSPPFKAIVAKGQIQLFDKHRFVLENLSFALNNAQVALEAHGSGDLQQKTVQATATLKLQMREDFPEIHSQKIRGRVSIPLVITALRAQQISIVGELGLENVSWQKADLSASGINGNIPFSEKLQWNGTNVRFSSLVTQNPFERVEFDRVRPLLLGSPRLRIEKVGWFEKSFGPMVGFFSLDQNMIFAHQFDMDLVNGKMYGEMFINFYPQTMQYGLLARMTGLDLGEILPKKFLNRVPTGSKTLSGRAGFVLNFNRNTLDGRVDVTEIGGSQLITAINIVDPLYADEKMNKMRRLLEVGYPTAVEVSFADGYMDMDLGLTVFGVSSRQSVHGVRISGALQKATAGFMETASKGPLQ